jgi:hypothetical protein
MYVRVSSFVGSFVVLAFRVLTFLFFLFLAQPNAWISTQNILKCCGYANNTQVTSSYATGCYCFVSQSSSCAPVTAIGDPCRSAVLDDAMDQIKIVGAVGFVLIKCFLNSFYISELQLV